MLDIVPRGETQRAKRGGRVVRLTWQVPARLRRPARAGDEQGRPRATSGDIHFSRSRLRVLAPPYTGSLSRRRSAAGTERGRPVMAQARRPAQPVLAQPIGMRQESAAERDVPYQFPTQAHMAPRREAFVLPTPRWAPWRGVLLQIAIFVVGCLSVVGAVGQLRGASQAVFALEPLKRQALQALDNMAAASAALAQTDFEASERQLAQAEAALATAQSELHEVLSGTRSVLRYLDVTGTVRSGEELLSAGQRLTEAGQHAARGLAALLTPNQAALTDAISLARGELSTTDEQLAEAQRLLARVNGPLLPAAIRDTVHDGMIRVPRIRAALSLWLEQSEAMLTILGADRERDYLWLLQNNHELRPTGGFIGSVALLTVDRGAVEEAAVRSVYDLDGQLRDFIAPPDPLLPITDRWYLRDANWFVDWPVSARKTAAFFEQEGGPTVDGVIAATPEVIRALLAITGPIDMPEYGVTVDADSFWVTTQDQVTYTYDREANTPKQFLADLAPRLLERLLAVPPPSTMRVFSALARMIEEKHLLVYIADQELQQRLAAAGWAGELPRDKPGMLAVNNANIGGHKSDQFMEQAIDARYEVRRDGDVDVVLTIQRTHRGPDEALAYAYPPGEDPAQKNNVVYQRVLVPRGAQLVDAQGFDRPADIPRRVSPADFELTVDPELAEWQRGQVAHPSGTAIGQEASYTFFANWIVTEPGETRVATYHYRLPGGVDWPAAWDAVGRADGYIFKQPGDERTTVRLSLRLPAEAHILHTAPQNVTRPSAGEVLFAGELTRDVLVGAVFEAP